MDIGETVTFKPGREGTFDPATRLEIKAFAGPFAIVDVGRTEWPILSERLVSVDG